MKTPPDASGPTRSCSFTSCFCDNLSCKHSLLRRILYSGPAKSGDNGKGLTPRERKLLDKLIAEYDKAKSEILSGVTRSEQLKIDAQRRTHRQLNSAEDAESVGDILDLVKLNGKSKDLGHIELSECCSCCICNSSICSYYKRQRHRRSLAGRTNYSCKFSVSRHNRTSSIGALRLKEKNVCSDPCTCTTKLSSVITTESKKSNILLHPNKPLSIYTNGTNVDQKMHPNRPIKKHWNQIMHSELSMNRSLRGSMKSLNSEIRGKIKKPFKTITVLIKETKSKLKESLLKNDEIIKSDIQVGQRGGNSYEETLDNTNLLTSGELVINAKIYSNEDTTKKVNFWKPAEKIVRLMQKPTKLIGRIDPASETTTSVKTSIEAENRGSTLKLSKNAKHRQEQAGQTSCKQKLLAHSQDSKIRNRKHIKTKYGKVKYWPTPTCLSEKSTSQTCYNLLSLRKARLAETPRMNRLNIKEIIEKSLSDLETQFGVIQPVIKRKCSKKIGPVTSIKDISKMFLNIEGKQFVKSFTVGICTQPTDDLKEGTKSKVSPNLSMEPDTSKSVKKTSTESLSKVKKIKKKLDKKQSKNLQLDFLRTIQQDQSNITIASSGNIDYKSISKSLLLNNNYSHFSFNSLHSITLSGSNLNNLLNQSSVSNSYVPRCFCTTSAQVPVKDNYLNGHSNYFDRCKLSISACKILTIERQSDSRFSDKTKELVSSVSAKSPLNNNIVESQVHANTMLYSTLEISPFANVQTVYQCQPVKCPNMKQTVVKPIRRKKCLVPHKCESHMSVPIECDPNKCLKAVTKKALKSKSHSSQSLRAAITTLNIACPCKCQKCQVAPDIKCQRKIINDKLKQSQSKCPDRCTLPPPEKQCPGKKSDKRLEKLQSKCQDKCLATLSTIRCLKKKSDKKSKTMQSKIPDKRCRAATSSIATSQVRQDQSGADISPGIRLTCRPRPSPCPVQCVSNAPGLLTTTGLFIRRCFCQQKLIGNKAIQQCAQMLKSEKKHLKENNATVTSKPFGSGDRNFVLSLNQSCDSTAKKKTSQKSNTNSLCDSEYPKEHFCKLASNKQAMKVCSNYSFRVDFCKGPCPLSDQNSLDGNKTVSVGKTPINNASSECKWELITPHTSPVFSITYKCESTSKESQKNKSRKKQRRDKSPSSEICKNKKSKPDQCPSVKCKSKHQKPQKSITVLTVCKGRKNCPSVKSTIKNSSKNISICTQKQLASCKRDCKPTLNCKCEPQQSQEGLKDCNKVKSLSAEVECPPIKPIKTVSVCKNSRDSKQSEDSSVGCKFESTECHKSVTVNKEKAKAKRYTSTETDKSVIVRNEKQCTQCPPSVKDKRKPHENTSICQYCKLQMKRTSLVCKCKTTESHKCVAASKDKEDKKYFPTVECDCKPIKPHKSSSVCKSYKGNKKIKSEPIESHKGEKNCKKNKRINYCPSTKSQCECVKPQKSVSICKKCKSKKKIKCRPLVCECKSIEPDKRETVCKKNKLPKCTPVICECKSIKPDKSGKVCKKNKLPKCCPSVKCECKCIKPEKKTSGLKKCNGNKKLECQLLVSECKHGNPYGREMKKFKHRTPLICECKPVKLCKKKCSPSVKSECKSTEPHKSVTVCKKGNKQAKFRLPLKCECKYIEPSKIVAIGKKDNKQLIYRPPVHCECKSPVKYKSQISCKNKARRAEQQKCCQPVKCECSSYYKNNKKSQKSSQDEDITIISQLISCLLRFFKSVAERDETEKQKNKKHKTKRHKDKKYDIVCPYCGHRTKASQTSCNKTKSSSKKNQTKGHIKVKSCSVPRQQECSGSESSICRKRRKQKRSQCECKSKPSHKNNKFIYDIETENRSIKTLFLNFLRKIRKCTRTSEKQNVQCKKAKISVKENKLAAQPCQPSSGQVKHSQKKLKKCGSKGNTVSKKCNATISTFYSESTQCSKKRANKLKNTRCERKQCIQRTKSKSSGKEACKQKRCYSNIGDTGPIVKHCYCSSKSCKNASKNHYTNCRQVYHVETQPVCSACCKPLVENLTCKFDPGFFVLSQHNCDESLQNIICCDKKSMLKSSSQMVDVKTETKSFAVERALMRRLSSLEIKNADASPTITVGRVPIKVDKRNYKPKRHLPALPSHELGLFAPNEISTIFPYTPENKLSKKEVSQNLHHEQQIYQSSEKSISKSRQYRNYVGLKQKSKHTEKRKINVPKDISPQVIHNDEQVQKKSISSGITRIVNICLSLFTRQKKTTSKSGNCNINLYQTDSLKMPYKKIHSLVENVSNSDSQPKEIIIERTKPPKNHANPKIRKHKVGTKHGQDLISKQQIEAYLQSGDGCEHVLNVPDICIKNKYPGIESQKEILSYFCKPQLDTGIGFNPYARDYTVGYAFRSRKQKHNCHHHCTSGVQSSSRGLFRDAKSETKDGVCNSRCTGVKTKGNLKKKPLQKSTIKRKHLKHKSMSCCDVCCDHKKHTKALKRGKEGEKGCVYHQQNEGSKTKQPKQHNKQTNNNKQKTNEPKRKFSKKHIISRECHQENEGSTSKSGIKRILNKKIEKSRAVSSVPCDSSCLVNLTREGRLEKPKPKIQKPLRFRKTCRDDCKHMKHMERVKMKKEEKIKKEKIKESRSQTKKLTPRSLSNFLRSITSLVGKSKTSVPRQKYDMPSTPLFEIRIDSKDYRVLNREQTIYSISEWQKKQMERRTAKLRHGKDCKCCICVRSALQQSSRTRKKNDKTAMVLKNSSTVECVCGSAVCDKERKKMINQLEQEISRQKAQQKPCVCGSKICAREAEIALKGKGSKLKGKGKEKGKSKLGNEKKKKEKKKKEKKAGKDKYKKEKEKRQEKERKKMEKMKEKKKKKPDKDKRKKEIEKAQEKLQRKEEKKKEKLEKEKEKKEMLKTKKPKKTAKELLDQKMKRFSDARKKGYQNWQKSREFKRNNKYEVAARKRHKYYVAKMNRLESNATQERSEADMRLIAKSIADLFDVSATCVQSAARQTYRRIMQPEPKEKNIKRQSFKTNQLVVRTTFRNIQRRLLLTKIFGFIGRLGGGSNRYRRKRRSPENGGCNIYMQTLRVKRCLWIYNICPWFYPYCLNIITVWRHFAFFLLFFVGAILWTPCFICVELCNFLLCCHC